jgi:predicted signal transduction protein with EAL and GGDEF domain
LVVAVADRLRACSRLGDTVARLGGDECMLLLDAVAEARDAVQAAERIREQSPVPIVLDGREVARSASIGIALHTGDDDTPEALLRRADLAMYRAKLNGKGRCEMLNDHLDHAQVHVQTESAVQLHLSVAVRQSAFATGKVHEAEVDWLLEFRRGNPQEPGHIGWCPG